MGVNDAGQILIRDVPVDRKLLDTTDSQLVVPLDNNQKNSVNKLKKKIKKSL